MSCRVQKPDGTVEYTLPNKKESQLFKALKAATENNNEAERFYNEVSVECRIVYFYGY